MDCLWKKHLRRSAVNNQKLGGKCNRYELYFKKNSIFWNTSSFSSETQSSETCDSTCMHYRLLWSSILSVYPGNAVSWNSCLWIAVWWITLQRWWWRRYFYRQTNCHNIQYLGIWFLRKSNWANKKNISSLFSLIA